MGGSDELSSSPPEQPKRPDLPALLYARGYRRGRLAADLPMPADTIRDELTETRT